MPDYNVTVSMGGGGVANPTGWYSLTAYGAAGDGVTDDTSAVQAAITAAVTNGGRVYAPEGDYLVSSTLTCANTDDDVRVVLDFADARFLADSGLAGPILTIGDASSRCYNTTLTGGYFGMTTRDWTDTYGVRLLNLYNSDVGPIEVYGCEKGLALESGTGSNGCVYNTISARSITDCLWGIYLENSTDGWVNENTFVGDTKIRYTSSLAAVDCSSGAAIYGDDNASSNVINNNKFIGLSLETSSLSNKPASVDFNGQHNMFIGIRYEGFDNPHISFGADSQMNWILGGYLAYPELSIDATSLERVTVMSGKQFWLSGGNSTYPLANIKENNSINNLTWRIIDTNAAMAIGGYANGTFYLKPGTGHGTPVEGMLHYDSGTSKLRVYTGSGWETVTSS